jgi:hypothetical protein
MSAEQPSPPNGNASPSASEGTTNNNDASSTANAAAAAPAPAAAAAAAAEVEVEVEEFPSILTCPISFLPPAVGVTFDLPGNNPHSPQVFNRSDLLNHIGTAGVGRAVAYVRHPHTNASVVRPRAMLYVNPVTPQVQAIIDQERTRQHLDLGPEPPNPSDQLRFQETMRKAREYLDRHRRGWEEVASGDSSGDELLAVRSPIRRRLNGGGPAPSANVTATSPRSQMGGFLNAQASEIRSSAHSTALIGLLQLAGNHTDGIAASLGQNNRQAWLTQNIDVIFGDGG